MERTAFPGTAAAVRQARHHLLAALHDVVSEDVGATAGLLASELATNAVMHANSAFTLSADVGADRLRVEVEDGSSRMPTLRRIPLQAIGGRGLHLVDVLSSRWGAEPLGGGKRVWFELPRW